MAREKARFIPLPPRLTRRSLRGRDDALNAHVVEQRQQVWSYCANQISGRLCINLSRSGSWRPYATRSLATTQTGSEFRTGGARFFGTAWRSLGFAERRAGAFEKGDACKLAITNAIRLNRRLEKNAWIAKSSSLRT